MTIDLSQLEGQGLAKSLFVVHHPFLKGFLILKHLNIALPKIFIFKN